MTWADKIKSSGTNSEAYVISGVFSANTEWLLSSLPGDKLSHFVVKTNTLKFLNH